MIGFRADLPALGEFVSALTAFDRRAADAMARLEAGARRLEESWDGAAAAAHAAARERWLRAEAESRDAVGELRRLVAVARGNYRAAAETNCRMWS